MRPRHLIPALLTLALLAYPLAAGPLAARYRYRRPDGTPYAIAPKWVMTAFIPLESLCEVSPRSAKVLIWYRDLWKPADAPRDEG